MKHKLIKVLSLMMALTMLMGSLVLTVGATDCAHETMDVVSEVAATCTTYGYTVKKCADCGYQVTTPTEKVEHEYATVPAVAPTCKDPGNVEYQGCVHCGKPETGVKSDYVLARTDEHEWELFVDEPGTGFRDENGVYRDDQGRLYKKCVVCDEIEVIEVFEEKYWGDSAHNFVYTITQEPTCITNGYATYSCAHCNQKWENIYVAPNATYGHSFTKDLALNSTCKGTAAKNYVVKVCAYCDMPETALPTTLDCNWTKLTANDQWTLDNDVEFEMQKDCLTDGYIVLICTNAGCGEHKLYTPTSDDANWFAYYDDYGTHEGHKQTAPITGTLAAGPCSYSTCSECHEDFPIKATHNWATDTEANRAAGKYTVTTEPNCYNKGEATVKCNDCNATKTVSIKALGHKIDLYECPACTAASKACTDCTHTGRTLRCSNAGCTQPATEVAKKDAHVKTGAVVEVPATCLTAGYKNQVCGQLGCTVSEKVAGSETALDPNFHYNFVVRDGSFTWTTTANSADPTYHSQYKCENATFAWTCACTGGEKVLDIYTDYDFLKANVKNADTLAEVKGEIGAAYFTGTGAAETLKAKDTFKGKGHLEYTTFNPKTNNKDNALGLLTTDFLGTNATNNTDSDLLNSFGIKAITATCKEVGQEAGKMCVRCGLETLEPKEIEKNPNNHKKADGTYRDDITITNYTPATCAVAEAIEFDCGCGAKNVKLTGNKVAGNHFWYTYNSGYDASTATGATTAAKITELTSNAFIQKNYNNRVFTPYKAATCSTAGKHANLYCALCKTTYAVTNNATLTAADALGNDPSTWTLTAVAKDNAARCMIAGCTCKEADGEGFKIKATIPVEIPALNHYNHELKKFGENTTVVEAAATGTENCFTDVIGKYKYCTTCAALVDEGQTGTDNAYVTGLKTAATIKAHGTANWTYVPYAAKTCTKNGVLEHVYCSKCQKYYLGATANTIPTDIEYTGNPNPNPSIPATAIKTAVADVTIYTTGHVLSTPVYYTLVNGVWVKGTTVAPTHDCVTSYFAASQCTSDICDAFNKFVDIDKDKHVDIDGEVSFFLNYYYVADGHAFATPNLPADYNYATAPSVGAVTYTVTENGTPTTKTSNVFFRWTSGTTCERTGEFYVKCAETGCTATHVIATIAAPGHKDWQGNALAVNCKNAGKICNVCSTTIAATCVDNDKVKVVVKAATCEEDGITLYTCTLCGKEYGANGTTPLKDLSEADYNAATKTNKLGHNVVTVFTESYVEPTLENEGSIKILCANCGEVVCKLDKLTDNDIYYNVVPYNPAVGVLPEGTDVAQGGMIKVSLMMNTGMVYNTLTLDIYGAWELELVDYDFKLETDPLLAVKNSLAVDDDGDIRIISAVTGTNKANVEVSGEKVVFADLYFKLAATDGDDLDEIVDDMFYYSDISGLVVDAEANVSSIPSSEFVPEDFAVIEAAPLFNANFINGIDEGDMIAIVGDLVAGVLGEEATYNAAADIDHDGKITVNDLQYLEMYLLTNQTFTDYVNVYLMAISGGKTTLADKIAAADLSKYDIDGDGKEGTSADERAFERDIYEIFDYIQTMAEYYLDEDYEYYFYEGDIETMVDNLVELWLQWTTMP